MGKSRLRIENAALGRDKKILGNHGIGGERIGAATFGDKRIDMTKHEMKNCPGCNAEFECKVGSILLCQCTTVRLEEEEREYINSRFDDCLCADCMKALKSEYHNQRFQDKLKSILGVFYKERRR